MIIQDEIILRRVSKKTSLKECKLIKIFERLLLELKEHEDSLGLSAIQIGEEIRACVVGFKDGSTLNMINPEIIEKDNIFAFQGEGCLSFPGKHVNTNRYNAITAKWVDEKGKKHKAEFMGIEAVELQHEIDHMDGILFFDRQLKPYKRETPKIGRNTKCAKCEIKYKKHLTVDHEFEYDSK